MTRNVQKWPGTVQNGRGWLKMAVDGWGRPGMAGNGRGCPKMARNCPKWPWMNVEGRGWPKMAADGWGWPVMAPKKAGDVPKRPQMDGNCRKMPEMARDGRGWHGRGGPGMVENERGCLEMAGDENLAIFAEQRSNPRRTLCTVTKARSACAPRFFYFLPDRLFPISKKKITFLCLLDEFHVLVNI